MLCLRVRIISYIITLYYTSTPMVCLSVEEVPVPWRRPAPGQHQPPLIYDAPPLSVWGAGSPDILSCCQRNIWLSHWTCSCSLARDTGSHTWGHMSANFLYTDVNVLCRLAYVKLSDSHLKVIRRYARYLSAILMVIESVCGNSTCCKYFSRIGK